MSALRPAALLLLVACGGSSAVGDRRCAADAGCAAGQRCVRVTDVLASTGDCLPSTGVDVCRPACPAGTAPRPCGCQ